MDLENAKENIQPLASGRNIQQLATAITADSQQDVQEELLKKRQEYESAVQFYVGDDPLGPWYEYVQWVEQSYPKSGKESALDDLLMKCLVKFEADERYKQDHRMIKLYIKYIDSQSNPTEHYQTLYELGIGTMVADLYIAWAYYYDLCDDFAKANSVYRKGIDARAQPFDQLEQAHKSFGFSMSQRMLNNECESYRKEFRSTMEERRFALTSLRAHKHNKHVGSIRIGQAIKSYGPGKINTTAATNGSGSSSATSLNNKKKSNVCVRVYNEESADLIDKSATLMPPPPLPSSSSASSSSSVVQIIMDSSKSQENLREPGPWSKANRPLAQSVFASSTADNRGASNSATGGGGRIDRTTMSFSILEDMEQTIQPILLNDDNFSKGINLPSRFYSKNEKQKPFDVPICGEVDAPRPRVIPWYDKIRLFPKPDKSYSIEELAAYKWFQKKGIKNRFCQEYDKVWKNEYEVGIRLPPFFCSKSSTPEDETPWTADRCADDIPRNCKFDFDIKTIYPPDDLTVEYSVEELRKQKWLNGELKSQKCPARHGDDELDETVCINRRQSIYKGVVCKSVCPGGRKSIMPLMEETRKSVWDYSKKKSLIPPPSSIQPPQKTTIAEEDEEELPQIINTSTAITSKLNIFSKPIEKKLQIFSINTKIQETVNNNEKVSAPTIPQSILATETIEEQGINKNGSGAIPKTKGILRKSINPTMKRKINPNESEIPSKEICFASTDKEMSSPKKDKSIKPFQFPEYVGNNDCGGGDGNTNEILTKFNSPKSSPIKESIFKTPKIPNNRTSVLFVNPDGDFNPQNYEADDTCSTIQFNHFIKATAISTPNPKNRPNSDKKVLNESIQPLEEQQKPIIQTISKPDTILKVSNIVVHEDEQQEKQQHQQQESSISPTPSPPSQQQQQQQQQPFLPRCLSTIMETTESTTKSSQFNLSPENEYEVTTTTKSHFANNYDSRFDQTPRASTVILTTTTTHSASSKFEKNNTKLTTTIGGEQPLISNKVIETSPPPKIQNNDDKENIPIFPVSNDVTTINTPYCEENTENIFFTEFSAKPKLLPAPAPSSPPTQLIYPSEFPSMASIQIYEDHTETVPITNLIKSSQITTVGDSQNLCPPSSLTVAQTKGPKNDMGDATVGAIPSMCPIPIYEDETETIPLLSIRCGQTEAKTAAITVQDIKNKTLSEPTITIPLMNFSNFNKTNNTSPPKISNKTLPTINASIPTETNQTFDDPTETIPMIMPNKFNRQTVEQFEAATTNKSMANRNVSTTNNDTIKVNRNSMFPQLVISNARTTMSAFDDYQPQQQKNFAEKENQSELPQPPKLNDIDDYFNELFAKTPVQPGSVNTDTSKQQKPSSSDEPIKQTTAQPFSKSSFISPGKSRIPIPKSYGKKGDLSLDDKSLLIPMIPNINTTSASSSTAHYTDDINNTSVQQQQKPLTKNISPPPICDNNTIITTTPSKIGSNLTDIPEQSIVCIKNEPLWTPSPMQYSTTQLKNISKISESFETLEIISSNEVDNEKQKFGNPSATDEQQQLEQSIYVPKTKVQLSTQEYVQWNEIDADDDEPTTTIDNEYLLKPINFNETKQVINAHCVDLFANPFDTKIKDAFLEQCELLDYIQKLPNCCLVNIVKPLRPRVLLEINDQEFNIEALVGKGAYGHIFKAKCTRTGNLYALKQERPANLWEYYICLEIESRIDVANILPAFMCVEYALIGNNASILCTRFSQYGNLIDVCNKVNAKTKQNVPEKIVMILAIQMLSIVDHLHACNIIHADIKPDNWLLVRKLNFEPNDIALQLIDFGQSIDMNLYPAGQTFNYFIKTNNFTCVEMKNNKPWTFQTDLYCLAGTIYTILMGRYMEVDRKLNGYEVRHGLPRYFQRNIWSQLFNTLINVKDCQIMPNLQTLRTLLLTEISSDVPKTNDQIVSFNKIIG